jgi:phosphate transport system permease protein
MSEEAGATVHKKNEQEGRFIRPSLASRLRTERWAKRVFFIITLLPVALALAVTIALALRAWPILSGYPLKDLLFGKTWKPDEGQFGFWPFITGTFWVTIVGVGLAVPPCILTALYLSEYARSTTRAFTKPLLDLLAAIPSVVYGVWGMLVIVPFVGNMLAPFSHRWLESISPILKVNQPTGFSILAGGIVLAVMIMPFIIAVVYEVLVTVPEGTRQAALGLGATRWQTTRAVVLPQVLPGIVAGIVLGASRALGETMAVLMVVGNVPQVPSSVFDAAYPLPALIANNYGEMMSIPLYDAALLAAALILLVIILFLNILSTLVLQRMLGRKQI